MKNIDVIKLIPAVVRRKIFKKKFTAIIDITNYCNLKCKHCYHYEFLNKGLEIGINDWKKRFSELKRAGIKGVVLTGGEPSLRMDVIKLAVSCFDFVTVYTNGQIKIPEDLKIRIFLSLDGLEEENDRVRGKGTFKQATENYKNDKRVIVYCILSKLNYLNKERLLDFLDFVNSFGVKAIKVDTFTATVNDFEKRKLILSSKEKIEIKKVLLSELERKPRKLMSTKKLLQQQFLKNDNKEKYCSMQENIVLDILGKEKRCVNNLNDCKTCSNERKLHIPFGNIIEWWRLKNIKKDYF